MAEIKFERFEVLRLRRKEATERFLSWRSRDTEIDKLRS